MKKKALLLFLVFSIWSCNSTYDDIESRVSEESQTPPSSDSIESRPLLSGSLPPLYTEESTTRQNETIIQVPTGVHSDLNPSSTDTHNFLPDYSGISGTFVNNETADVMSTIHPPPYEQENTGNGLVRTGRDILVANDQVGYVERFFENRILNTNSNSYFSARCKFLTCVGSVTFPLLGAAIYALYYIS